MTIPTTPVDYFSEMQANDGWRGILESFARFVQPSPNALLMDVGAGPGALVEIFADKYQAVAWGVDIDPAMMHRAKELRQSHRWTIGGLPQLPFGPNTFDCVTAVNVLYLINNPQAGFQEIGRVLKPQGTLAILNPSENMSIAAAEALIQEKGLMGFAKENFLYWATVATKKPRWTADELQTLFAHSGLHLTDTQLKIGDGLARYARGIKVV